MSLTTAWRWMRLLNFKYNARKKSFYVDGHKCEDVVENHKECCQQYLTELELYCRRWVQVSKEVASTIDVLELCLGHNYVDILKNTDMLKFHIDYWNQCCNKNESSTDVTLHPSIAYKCH
jgi:hypothetical protein